MPQGSMLSLVVFPSTIVLMGIVAFLVGWRRHARFMSSIRAKRAAEFNANHLSQTMAYEPEVLITNVMRADESVLIGYQPYLHAAQDVTKAQGTFVAFGSEASVLERLENWCTQQACIRVELDHLGNRLRLSRSYTTEQVELSMVPKKNVG
ncbi:hypothetical protein [Ferrimicrobium sp.]|uniref:hypothetical protein n=1 Tax=Ferrimicrobium sp. TaxID=2926050 RepID=UPI00261FC9D5|nr:hypothetical protein [Ferrimicrobium sp.]